jgi:hypothetical protein
MTVSFDGIELRDPAPFDLAPVVLTNETTLLSGKTAVQTTAETGLRVRLECVTQDYADVSALIAKIGQKKTLIINGTSYTNCAIKSWNRLEENPPGTWWYEVTFVRETA